MDEENKQLTFEDIELPEEMNKEFENGLDDNEDFNELGDGE